MKHFLSIIIMVFMLTGIAQASDVMLNWEMTETTGVKEYKIYYSTNEDMTNTENKICCVENTGLCFSSTVNLDIDTTKTTYFYISAITMTREVASDTAIIKIILPDPEPEPDPDPDPEPTLSKVQNLRII